MCRAAGQAGQPGDLGYSQLRALRRKAVEDSHRAIEALDPAGVDLSGCSYLTHEEKD